MKKELTIKKELEKLAILDSKIIGSSTEEAYAVADKAIKTGLKKLEGQLETKLRKINIEDYQDLSALVSHVFLFGSGIQQKGVSDSFDFEAALSLPNLKQIQKTYSFDRLVGAINEQLKNLASVYGFDQVRGDSSEISCIIIDDFYHLTLLDLIKFFSLVKKGKFKTETQHIASRGINLEFIVDWLNKFDDYRAGKIEQAKKAERDQRNNFSIDFAVGYAESKRKFEEEEKALQKIEAALLEEKANKPKEDPTFLQVIDQEIVQIWGKGKAKQIEEHFEKYFENYYYKFEKDLYKFKTEEAKEKIYQSKEDFILQRKEALVKQVMFLKKKTNYKKAFQDCVLSCIIKQGSIYEADKFLRGVAKESLKDIEDTYENRLKYSVKMCSGSFLALDKAYYKIRKEALLNNSLPVSKKEYISRNVRMFLAQKLGFDITLEVLPALGLNA